MRGQVVGSNVPNSPMAGQAFIPCCEAARLAYLPFAIKSRAAAFEDFEFRRF